MKKIILIILGVIVVAIVGFLLWFNVSFPKVSDAPDIKVDMSEENIKRGEYLANHVAVCIDCHSSRDWSKFSGPPVESTFGMGGEKFTEEMGLPGNFYSQNITPARLKDWTDGEIFRAITTGVNKEGQSLFPIMPYPNYAQMSKEDIYSIIAYIRSLKPVENEVPKSEASFPMSMIMKTIPKDAELKSMPDKSNTTAYGKYLFTAASCADCHTPSEKGQPIPGKELAGGREFPTPFGTLRTANITTDKETGIGNWTKEHFIARFKNYDPAVNPPISVEKGKFNSIMPWIMYAGMTEEDLGAMYDYIMTSKPIKNKVVTFSPIAQK